MAAHNRCSLRLARFGVALLAGWSMQALAAGDPAVGKMLYINPNGAPLGCAAAACHGPDPTQNKNGITRGADQPSLILNAINVRPDMMFLKNFVSAADAEHLAAYIANPNGAPTGSLTPAPAALAFGDQVIGSASNARTVTVTNGSTANVAISAVASGGANLPEFTPISGTCAANMTLIPNASCTVIASFKPAQLGARGASVSIIHSGANSPNVLALTGNGVNVAGPSANLSATQLAFANQAVSTTSAAKEVVLSNSGPVALTVNSISITGANASDFTRSGDCNAGTQLATNQSCKIAATFAPGAIGPRVGSIDVATNATGSPHRITVTGVGEIAPTPLASLSTNSLFFGNYNVGNTSAPLVVVLSNPGSMPLSIGAMTRTGADFAHTTTCGATLAPNATCNISATFTPTTVGAMLSGSIALQTNAPGVQPSITLAGAGIAAGVVLPTVTLNPATLDLGSQTLNTASTAKSLTLTNTGTVALTINDMKLAGSQSGEFARTGTCIGATPVMIAPNGTCTLAVTFTPTTTGSRSATLSVISNAQGAPFAALSGVGVAPAAPTVVISKTAVTFGDQGVGTTSAPQALVLSNTGTAALSIQSITASAEFSVTNTCGASLAVGANCMIGVSFAPTALGARTGKVTITDGAAGSPREITLSGNGVTASAQGAAAGSAGATDTGANAGGGGGCTMGSGGELDPLLALLALAALIAIYRRRARRSDSRNASNLEDLLR